MKRLNKKIILTTLIIFILFSLSVFITDFVEKTNFENTNNALYNTGSLLGLIGFLALALLIISGETARYFDKYFGIDIIIKTQRKFSIITTLIIITHPIFFALAYSSMTQYFLPQTQTITLLAGTISLYLLIIIQTASMLYKKISQTTWQYLHMLIYALFFLSLYHAINHGSSFQNNDLIKIIFYILIVGTTIGIIYRTQHKIKTLLKEKPRIKKIRKETHDTYTLITNKPKNFKYEAGQFCFLKLNKNKLYARHPFTISSAPHEKELKFTIKNTGKFTETAMKLKKEEPITIEGPYGTFMPEKNKDLLLVAGGVGITPFISIIKDKTQRKTKTKITLLYASKTEKDIIYKEELKKLQRKNNNLKVIHYISRENKKRYETRLNKENFLKHIKQLKQKKNQEKTQLMMCGPQELKQKIKEILKEKNIKIKQKEESFFW